MNSQTNRREYFRIDDRVAVRFTPLTEDFDINDDEFFDSKRHELGLANHFSFNREQHRPQLRKIASKHPEIASYLEFLEEEIQVLAKRLVSQDKTLPTVPNADVNICAEGFRIETKEPFPQGQRLEVSMLLFPSHTSIYAYAKVLRSDEITEGDEFLIGKYETVISFDHIHDEDKEALVKHIHQKQLLQLQERQEALMA
ncbi:MAG: PilZ domain-containing protein [bacterium]